MTHLPYILASYGLFVILAFYLSAGAALRLRAARLKLALPELVQPTPSGKNPSHDP